MKPKKNPGRPAGTPNSETVIVAVMPAACPKCGSTETEAVRIIRERHLPGISPNGRPRTHILWRKVRCQHCGQYFVEQEHQNRVGEEKTIENLDSCSKSHLSDQAAAV